jgi:hypothetical protein
VILVPTESEAGSTENPHRTEAGASLHVSTAYAAPMQARHIDLCALHTGEGLPRLFSSISSTGAQTASLHACCPPLHNLCQQRGLHVLPDDNAGVRPSTAVEFLSRLPHRV